MAVTKAPFDPAVFDYEIFDTEEQGGKFFAINSGSSKFDHVTRKRRSRRR